MDLVIDANILFAALVKRGTTAELIFRNEFNLYAPEFIFEEFEKYKEMLIGKTERTDEEFNQLLRILQRKITTIKCEESDMFFQKAEKIAPDEKDSTYLAVALKYTCAIWSNDKNLKEKQEVVKVYSTQDLIELF